MKTNNKDNRQTVLRHKFKKKQVSFKWPLDVTGKNVKDETGVISNFKI